jgi:hypothetical protein
MNAERAIQHIEAFLGTLQTNRVAFPLKDDIYASNRQWRQSQDEILSRRGLIISIAQEIDDVIAEKIGDRSGVPWEWASAEEGCFELLGHLRYRDNVEVTVGPGGPIGSGRSLGVEIQLHPGVWQSTSPAWEEGWYADAVKAATLFVLGSLGGKLRRHDTSGVDLISEAFSLEPPGPGRPRLRLPRVTPDTEAWVNAHTGVRSFGVGCVLTLPNLTAGELEPGDALQFLVGLSMFARWVDDADVAHWQGPRA